LFLGGSQHVTQQGEVFPEMRELVEGVTGRRSGAEIGVE
jgi:hypothetical protein